MWKMASEYRGLPRELRTLDYGAGSELKPTVIKASGSAFEFRLLASTADRLISRDACSHPRSITGFVRRGLRDLPTRGSALQAGVKAHHVGHFGGVSPIHPSDWPCIFRGAPDKVDTRTIEAAASAVFASTSRSVGSMAVDLRSTTRNVLMSFTVQKVEIRRQNQRRNLGP
jgi:hypothetical protein